MDMDRSGHAGIRKDLRVTMANHLSWGLYIVFPFNHAVRDFSLQKTLLHLLQPAGSILMNRKTWLFFSCSHET